MIPIYPKFSKLMLDQKEEIEKFVSNYPPYSDFNFTSLWTYNTQEIIKTSLLNDNFVVMFQDYMDGKPFYSFLGTNKVNETIRILINLSCKEKMQPILKLVPEVVVQKDKDLSKYFNIKEDPDNFDYILSVQEIADLKGKKYYDKRNLINRFNRLYPEHKIERLKLTDKKAQEGILNLFLLWSKQAKRSKEDYETELDAIKRLLALSADPHYYAVAIYYQNKMIGFLTYELAHSGYGIMSFEKGDRTYEGIYSVLNQEGAKHLLDLKQTYINYEQDLGIPGLKKAKSLWRPIYFLKKYIITPK